MENARISRSSTTCAKIIRTWLPPNERSAHFISNQSSGIELHPYNDQININRMFAKSSSNQRHLYMKDCTWCKLWIELTIVCERHHELGQAKRQGVPFVKLPKVENFSVCLGDLVDHPPIHPHSSLKISQPLKYLSCKFFITTRCTQKQNYLRTSFSMRKDVLFPF